MKILQLQLYVLLCCQAAVSDLQSDLGSNVSINCDLDENEVNWIFQKTPDLPTVILRSFSPPTPPFYSNKSFRNKYSVQFKHRLVINNITADELGVYYCMTTGAQPKFSNSSRIYITEPTQSSDRHNQTVCEQNFNCADQNHTKWQTFFFISGVMNGFLVMVVVGLVKCFVVGNRSSAEQSQFRTDLPQTQVEQQQGPDQLQYATMDFSKFRKKMRSSQNNTTYAALNLPGS